MGGSSNSYEQLQKQQQQQQAGINAGMKDIDKAFSGFTPEFYNQRAQAYEQFAMPQLENQFRDTSKNLEYKLNRNGMGKSSAADQMRGKLNQQNKLAETNVVNQGTQQAQQLEQQVQGQKNALVSELQSAVAPQSVAQQAIGTAAGFQGPSTFAPVGQAFTDFSNMYLQNQQANMTAPYYAQMLYNSGFGRGGSPIPNN